RVILAESAGDLPRSIKRCYGGAHHERQPHRADRRAPPADDPQSVRERRHHRIRTGGAYHRSPPHLSRRERSRPRDLRARRGTRAREPRGPHRGKRSHRAHPLPHGSHRRGARDARHVDARSLRRRAGEWRGVGTWRGLRVTGTPGHGSMPYGADNALVKAAHVVSRLADYRPAPYVDHLWKTFVGSLGVDPDLKEALRDPSRVDDAIARLPAGVAK